MLDNYIVKFIVKLVCLSPYLATRQRSENTLKQRMLAPRLGTLWIYGDSLSDKFYKSIKKKPLCSRIFASCSSTYNWVYPLALRNSLQAKLDFRPSIILDTIRSVLRDSRMKSSQSLLVLNLGIHYAYTISFATYQKFIDDVIVILLDREKGLGSKAEVIWKTSTSMRKENEESPRNFTCWRFLTEQVRQNFLL